MDGREHDMPLERNHFQAERERVSRELLTLASRVEEDLRKAVEALRLKDAELAAYVKADDAIVNAMQLRVEDMAAVLIATQQPVARDLRELVATIRLADSLERMGDYAVHLAKAVLKLRDSSWPRQFELLAKMGDEGCLMLHAMVDAFIAGDTEAARECAKRDGAIDELHHQLLSETLEHIKTAPEKAEEAIKLIRTSGFMERLGDHVTNSCELVIYVAKGSHEELND
jgi:phosphate transport system protein